MTVTNQPSGKRTKRAAAATPGNRLPSSRERRPALAALAVLLIAGGAVLAGWLALRESQTATFLKVTAEVNKGEQVAPGDVGEIELPSDTDDVIAADLRGEIVGSYALTDWVPGQPLVEGMAGDEPTVGKGMAWVGLDLEPGLFPPGMAVGDDVQLTLVEGDGTATGEIVSIKGQSSGDAISVAVLMSDTCNIEFSKNAADGNVSVSSVAATDAPPSKCQ